MTYEEQLVRCSLDELVEIVAERVTKEMARGDRESAARTVIAALSEAHARGERLTQHKAELTAVATTRH